MRKTPLKKGNKPLKRTPFKRVKPVKKDEDIDRKIAMNFLFQELWWKGDKKSELSGTSLGSRYSSAFYHHILPKETYPQYTLCRENIIQVTLEEHDAIHNNIDNFPTVKRKYLELMEKHLNFTQIN